MAYFLKKHLNCPTFQFSAGIHFNQKCHYLDRVIVEVGDDDLIQRVDGDELWPGKFGDVTATRSELLDELAARLKDENGGLLAVDDDHVA